MPNEDEWSKKNRSRKEYMPPKRLPIIDKKHEKWDTSMTREEKVILGVIQYIIEKESDILVSENNLVWMNSEVSEHDKKSSNHYKKCNRFDRENNIFRLAESEERSDYRKNKGSWYDDPIDIESGNDIEK
jgi:hypothetical protein